MKLPKQMLPQHNPKNMLNNTSMAQKLMRKMTRLRMETTILASYVDCHAIFLQHDCVMRLKRVRGVGG